MKLGLKGDITDCVMSRLSTIISRDQFSITAIKTLFTNSLCTYVDCVCIRALFIVELYNNRSRSPRPSVRRQARRDAIISNSIFFMKSAIERERFLRVTIRRKRRISCCCCLFNDLCLPTSDRETPRKVNKCSNGACIRRRTFDSRVILYRAHRVYPEKRNVPSCIRLFIDRLPPTSVPEVKK